MKALLSLESIGLLSGCASVHYGPPPPPPLMVEMPVMNATAVATIGFGGRAAINGVRIVPRRVIEDSRCPANVQCVWAGRLILEAQIGTPGQPDSVRQLTLGQPLPLPGGTLTMVAVMPPRVASGGPAPSSFTFEWHGL